MLKIHQLKQHHMIDNVNIAYANNFHVINDLEYEDNNAHVLVDYNVNIYVQLNFVELDRIEEL